MSGHVFTGDAGQPYPEIEKPDAGNVMVIDLSGSHRLGYPDLWVVGQVKALTPQAQRCLLDALGEVRELRPMDYWFFYCDCHGYPNENPWYLMRSSDGLVFKSLTWESGWEAFVGEVEMLIANYNRAPATDPTEKAIAKFLGYTPLDG